jgi:hypothetical protein
MDMFGLLIAVVIAIPVLAIVSIALTIGTRERLKRLEFRLASLDWLEFRLASLETRLAGTAGDPAPKPISAPAPEALPSASEPPGAKAEDVAPPPSEPEPPAAAPAPPAPAARPKISL